MSIEVTRSAIAGMPTSPQGPNMLKSLSASERTRVSWSVLRTPLVPAKSNRYDAETSIGWSPPTPTSTNSPSVP